MSDIAMEIENLTNEYAQKCAALMREYVQTVFFFHARSGSCRQDSCRTGKERSQGSFLLEKAEATALVSAALYRPRLQEYPRRPAHVVSLRQPYPRVYQGSETRPAGRVEGFKEGILKPMRFFLPLLLLASQAHAEDPPQCETAFNVHSKEYADCNQAWRDKWAREEEARKQVRRDREKRQQDLAADPRTPEILATAAVMAFQTLRKRALEELAEQKRYGRMGSENKPMLWTIQERIRYYDHGLRLYRAKAKADRHDRTVSALYACFVQYPDSESGPCAEEIVSLYTENASPMNLN